MVLRRAPPPRLAPCCFKGVRSGIRSAAPIRLASGAESTSIPPPPRTFEELVAALHLSSRASAAPGAALALRSAGGSGHRAMCRYDTRPACGLVVPGLLVFSYLACFFISLLRARWGSGHAKGGQKHAYSARPLALFRGQPASLCPTWHSRWCGPGIRRPSGACWVGGGVRA